MVGETRLFRRYSQNFNRQILWC